MFVAGDNYTCFVPGIQNRQCSILRRHMSSSGCIHPQWSSTGEKHTISARDLDHGNDLLEFIALCGTILQIAPEMLFTFQPNLRHDKCFEE